MTVTIDRDMERAFAQLYEIQKHLLNGSLSPLVARRPLQDIIEGKLPQDGRFDRFSGYLLSLDEQLERLRDFNRRFWNNRLTDEQLAAVDTSSDHDQRVDDLEVLYVDFGSPEDNVELWWKVLVGTQPNAWRYDGLKTGKKNLRLAEAANQYEPGLHRIRLNLVAHWEPEEGRTVQEVRQQAKASGETLAASEVLAAYGLHDQLLQQMDGENFPYADLGGYETTIPGSGAWRSLPCLGWDSVGRGVRLHASWDDGRDCYWACPVVVRRES